MRNSPIGRTFLFRRKEIACLKFDGCDGSLYLDQNEPEVKEKFWNINPGDVVLDIGGELGAYTLTALALGASRVIVWDPAKASLLQQNVEINGWQNRCIVIDQALWNRTGFVSSNCPNMPLFSDKPCHGFYPADTLDNSIAINEPRIDWIKIDTEGAELEILQGGEKIVRTHRPNLLIENHLFKDADVGRRVKEFLFELNIGYQEIDELFFESGAVSHSFYSSNQRGNNKK